MAPSDKPVGPISIQAVVAATASAMGLESKLLKHKPIKVKGIRRKLPADPSTWSDHEVFQFLAVLDLKNPAQHRAYRHLYAQLWAELVPNTPYVLEAQAQAAYAELLNDEDLGLLLEGLAAISWDAAPVPYTAFPGIIAAMRQKKESAAAKSA